MWKIIGISASVAISGVVTFYVTLLSLGKPLSGDEVLTNGSISIVAAILGGLGTGAIVWFLHKRRVKKGPQE